MTSARENACDKVAIDFGFAFDWLRRWCEFFKPIVECKKQNQNQSNSVITFDNQLKTALYNKTKQSYRFLEYTWVCLYCLLCISNSCGTTSFIRTARLWESGICIITLKVQLITIIVDSTTFKLQNNELLKIT